MIPKTEDRNNVLDVGGRDGSPQMVQSPLGVGCGHQQIDILDVRDVRAVERNGRTPDNPPWIARFGSGFGGHCQRLAEVAQAGQLFFWASSTAFFSVA